MPFKLSLRSQNNLEGVHPDLIKVVQRAIKITSIDFGIIDGLRTVTEQKANVAKGASKTMLSRHLTGHAVDVGAYVDGQYINGDTPSEYRLYEQIADAFKIAAHQLGIPIVWGGDWKTLKDGCHFELDRRVYP